MSYKSQTIYIDPLLNYGMKQTNGKILALKEECIYCNKNKATRLNFKQPICEECYNFLEGLLK